MKHIIRRIALLLTVATALPAVAVTTQEMEKARAITAQCYLRYANDGSGYLDELDPASLADLEKSLKPKEKENIKTFKQLAAFPPDYQKWGKDELVKYWSQTFFASSQVPADARRAKPRVARRLSAMNVSGPGAAEVQQPAAEATESIAAPQVEAIPAAPADVADTALEAAEEEAAPVSDSGSSDATTWIYIAILVVVVIVVICLVVYAMNAMKGRSSETDRDDAEGSSAEIDELRDKLARTISEKNAEIEELRRRLADTEERLAEAELRLRREASSAYRARTVSGRPDREVYLARANARGIFVRADSQFSMGNSIFRLVTSDGLTGTFTVIDDPSVFEVALMMPADYLLNACTGRNLQLSSGMREIVTDTPGTAVFEDGRWRVTRKAAIHYLR